MSFAGIFSAELDIGRLDDLNFSVKLSGSFCLSLLLLHALSAQTKLAAFTSEHTVTFSVESSRDFSEYRNPANF